MFIHWCDGTNVTIIRDILDSHRMDYLHLEYFVQFSLWFNTKTKELELVYWVSSEKGQHGLERDHLSGGHRSKSIVWLGVGPEKELGQMVGNVERCQFRMSFLNVTHISWRFSRQIRCWKPILPPVEMKYSPLIWMPLLVWCQTIRWQGFCVHKGYYRRCIMMNRCKPQHFKHFKFIVSYSYFKLLHSHFHSSGPSIPSCSSAVFSSLFPLFPSLLFM